MAEEGIDILISDSTNAMYPGFSPTEQKILTDIEKCIEEAKGKVVLTTFASNVTRIKVVVELAIKHNRKVVAFGRSMVKAIDMALALKYIEVPAGTFIDKKDIGKYPDKEILALTTGSQGEELAVLSKTAEGKHPQLTVKDKDVIIFSSSAIPGNKIKIELLVNDLYKTGAEVKEHKIDGMLHTSGHAYKDEHDTIFKITKPKYFIPYHGAYRQSAVHTYSAIQAGVKKENNIIIGNGQVVELKDNVATLTNEIVDVGPIFIDSNMAVKGNTEIIKDRERLGINGFVNIIVTIDKNKKEIIGRTKVISRGAIYVKDSRELMNEVQRLAHGGILHTIKNNNN